MFEALPLHEVQDRGRPTANFLQIQKLLVQPQLCVQRHFCGDGTAGLPLDFSCRRVRRIPQSFPRHLLHVLVGWGSHYQGGSAKACQAGFLRTNVPRAQFLGRVE